MIVVGIDEVGRGCWAGPLVAGAAVLDRPIKGLKDSKKLSKQQREILAVQIQATATAIGLGWVSAVELDEVGITAAVKLAMQRALDQINMPFDELIIDGNINYFPDEPRAKAIIKADDTVTAVSAASIVAKVARDKYMAEMAQSYPAYGFEKHVGYGTKLHMDMLGLYGITDLHRQSFKPIQLLMAAHK